MKTIKKLAFGLALAAVASSCNIMDYAPSDRYGDAVAFSTKANIDAYALSLYSTAEVYGQFGSRAFGTSHFNLDGLTPMLKYSSDVAGYGTPNVILFIEGQITPVSNAVSYWADCYTRIRKVNEFLDGIQDCTILTDAEKNAYIAEARFFRGYLYFLLTRAHKNVILYDGLGDWKNSAKKNSPEAECWEFVKADLTFAMENLSQAKRTDGRVDQATAAALLSRAMLFAKDWETAKTACEKVIEIGYTLDPDYAEIFKHHAGTRSSETIFQVDYLNENYCHSFDSKNCPSGDDANAEALCPAPTQEFVECYEKATGGKVDWTAVTTYEELAATYASLEPRFQASVLYDGADWKGRKIETYAGGKDGYVKYGSTNGVPKTTVTGYYMRKMLDENNKAITTDKSTQSYVMIRYAEVLLNYAEALANLGAANFGKAMQQVNAVRGRVGLPEVSADNFNDVMAAIMQERKIELAFEGFYYWDCKRWGIAENTLGNVECHGIKITKSGDTKTFEYESCDGGQQRLFPKKYYSLPIPSSEISNNPECEQLPEWTEN